MKDLIIIGYIMLGYAFCTGCTHHSDIPGERLSLSCFSVDFHGGTSKMEDFGLYLDTDNQSDPIHVTYTDSWSLPSVFISQPTKVYAFHPYIPTSKLNLVPLELSQQTSYQATVQPFVTDKEKPCADLLLHPLLAKLQVTLNGSCDVQITAKDVPSKGCYDLENRQLNLDETSRTDIQVFSSLLVFPCDHPLTLLLDWQGKSYTFITPTRLFETGKEYIYDLQAGDDKLPVLRGEVTVKDWITGGSYKESINV